MRWPLAVIVLTTEDIAKIRGHDGSGTFNSIHRKERDGRHWLREEGMDHRKVG